MKYHKPRIFTISCRSQWEAKNIISSWRRIHEYTRRRIADTIAKLH